MNREVASVAEHTSRSTDEPPVAEVDTVRKRDAVPCVGWDSRRRVHSRSRWRCAGRAVQAVVDRLVAAAGGPCSGGRNGRTPDHVTMAARRGNLFRRP